MKQNLALDKSFDILLFMERTSIEYRVAYSLDTDFVTTENGRQYRGGMATSDTHISRATTLNDRRVILQGGKGIGAHVLIPNYGVGGYYSWHIY